MDFGLGSLVYCKLAGGNVRPGVVTEVLDANTAHVSVFTVPSLDETSVPVSSRIMRYSETLEAPETFQNVADYHTQNTADKFSAVSPGENLSGETQAVMDGITGASSNANPPAVANAAESSQEVLHQ